MSVFNFGFKNPFANGADASEIQPFPDENRGLGIAFDQTEGKPEMKGLNGLFNKITQSLLSIRQNGLLGWVNDLEYMQGGFVIESGKLYQAKQNNTNKQPSLSQNDWELWDSPKNLIVDDLVTENQFKALSARQGKILSDILDVIAYSPIPYFGNTAPAGFIGLFGQEITAAKYPKLFMRYGARLPNLNDGSFIRGVGGGSSAMGVKQLDSMQNITAIIGTVGQWNIPANEMVGGATYYDREIGQMSSGSNVRSSIIRFDASRVVRTSSETRPKNIAFLYIVKEG